MSANKYQVTNVRTKFYAKGTHKSFSGHTVHIDIAFVNDKEEIEQQHIVLNWTNLIHAGISKLEYLKTKQ